MERKISFAAGEYYHIYNRGVEKRDIFLDETDCRRFTTLLHLANSPKPFVYKTIQGRPLDTIDIVRRRVAIGAYALMSNHFHVLLKVSDDESGVSSFMEKLQTGYSMYFNKKNGRVGPLFQGRFKAEHVVEDDHLKYLFAYIHLNPLKRIEPQWKEIGLRDSGAAKQYIRDYPYSSYQDYLGVKRSENTIISPEHFPEYFSSAREVESFMDDWLSMEPRAALG